MNPRSFISPIGCILLGAVLATIIVTQNQGNGYRVPGSTTPSHPAVTSNEDPYGERSLFNFSPNRNHIAFIQDVFTENDQDYDHYYSIQVFDVKNRKEKAIFVGSYKTSGFEWLDNKTIRIYLDAGTGVRVYRDIDINRTQPLMDDGTNSFWTPDEEYAHKARSYGEAWRIYNGVE